MLLALCGFAIVPAHAAEPVTTHNFNRAETHVNFETPDWEKVSRKKIRDGLLLMGGTLTGSKRMFGYVGEVDPVRHLIGTAGGFGGNPEGEAIYLNVFPENKDGKTPSVLSIKDVPVDGFWSISQYNTDGFFEKNDSSAYSFNNITAKRMVIAESRSISEAI